MDEWLDRSSYVVKVDGHHGLIVIVKAYGILVSMLSRLQAPFT